MPWEVVLVVLVIFGGLTMAYWRIYKNEKANPLPAPAPKPPSPSIAEALAFINKKGGTQ